MADRLYDSTRDPFVDTAIAMARARQEHKNVLFEVGGDWCTWCYRLETFISVHPELARLRAEHFISVKICVGEHDELNEEFMLQLPMLRGVPHLFVYNGKGQLLCSQGTEELEQGESYSYDRVKAFLVRWSDPQLTPYDGMSTEELRQRFGRRLSAAEGDGPVLTA